jgi:zinc protease
MARAGLFLALVLMLVPGMPGARQQWPRESPPPPLTARAVSFPPYQIKTLANGLQVLVVLHHEEPSVSFRLLVRAGAMQEPVDKPGVASFVSALLDQGTTTKSAEAIADLIESAGGVIGVGAGYEMTSVSGAVIKDQTDLALGLAADLVEHPAFAPEEIDRQRRQALSGLQVSYDDPGYLADTVFSRLVFGSHPYGRPSEGTPESIARISRDDLVAFHHAWFSPNNSLLAIVGDLTATEAMAAAERAFATWARKDVPVVAPVEPPAPARRVVVIDRPGSAQTEIRLGHLAIARTHPDYLPLDLAIRILGGEGANRLFGVLRTDRGLTYGASADMHTFKSAGDFVAQTNTRPQATGEALRLMVEEYGRLRSQRVDPRELHGAQEYLAGNFPLSIETPGAIAAQVLNQLFYGMDLKDLETFRDRVDRVSVEEIQRVSRQFLMPDRLSIVLVGDAAGFLDQLKALGFGQVERIPLSQLDLGSPTLKRASPPIGRDDQDPNPPPV